MKLKLYLGVLLLLCLTSQVFGQDKQKMEKENVVQGVVIIDGKEIEGYMKKVENYLSPSTNQNLPCPWGFQKSIKFIAKDIFDNSTKLKNKDYTKYEPKDCQGYSYDNNTYTYESVKLDAKLGMGIMPSPIFLRVLSKKKISMYQFFYSDEDLYGKMDYAENEKPISVYRVGKEGKLKFLTNMLITKELKDCPIVMERYGKGNQEDAQKKGLINTLVKITDEYRLSKIIRAIDDYNENCP